jgi:hypothetical protein
MKAPPRSVARCLVAVLVGLAPAIALPSPASPGTPAAMAATAASPLMLAATAVDGASPRALAATAVGGASPRTLAVAAVGGASPRALAVAAARAASPRAGCPLGGVEVDLAGSGDTAVVSGHAGSACRTGAGPGGGGPQPFWTYEIACSTDRAHAEQGLCASTPCGGGLFFAFRTLHRPDGRTEPAGSSCVSLDRAPVGRAVTAAEVFAAIRRVKLPGGEIHVAPSGRGLANVPSHLWLAGDVEPPVNLRLAGSTVHAEFQPVRYRWTIEPGEAGGGDVSGRGEVAGSGRTIGPSGAGRALTVVAGVDSSGRDGEAGVTFPGRGDFVVTVVTAWSASAFLDGRFVGQVDGLASTARIAYPVAELRTALSG